MSERGWRGKKDLLSIDDLSLDEINFILDLACFLEPFSGIEDDVIEPLDICKGKQAVIMSFEETTRTGSSSDAAVKRLGGNAVVISKEGSAMGKGESSNRTIRNIRYYGDILGIRGPDAKEYARLSNKPVINLGDAYEHPTQAIQNASLIRKKRGRLDHLNIGYLNDLIFGRVMLSEMKLFRKEKGNRFFGIPSNDGFRAPDGLKGTDYKEITLEDIPSCDLDVLHVVRPQFNRMSEGEKTLYRTCKTCIPVDNDFIKKYLPSKTLIMHDQPNVEEILECAYENPQVVVDYQSALGVPTRMAIFGLWLGYEDALTKLMKSRQPSDARA